MSKKTTRNMGTEVADEPEFGSIADAQAQTLPVPAAQVNHAVALNTDNRGMEEVDSTDLIIPRAQLLQPTAEGLRQLTADYGVGAGDVINNLTKEKLAAGFVPIFYYKEALRFNPRKKDAPGFLAEYAPGKLIWRTRDMNDPRVLEQCSFGPNGEVPVAVTTLNFFSLFDGQAMPVILSFSKTSYKAGKNLLSLAKLRGGAMFSRRYKLSTDEVTNDQGTYFVMKVQPAGDCDPEMFKTTESYFQQFGMKRDVLKDHIEEMEA